MRLQDHRRGTSSNISGGKQQFVIQDGMVAHGFGLGLRRQERAIHYSSFRHNNIVPFFFRVLRYQLRDELVGDSLSQHVLQTISISVCQHNNYQAMYCIRMMKQSRSHTVSYLGPQYLTSMVYYVRTYVPTYVYVECV